jgi:iron(III) transport system ATP-binding protein
MASIRISSLVVGYGAQPVIRDVSLTIENGHLFTLLGPSGCGKTTLLRTIAGFNPITSGSLHFGERDVTRLPAHLRDVGMVFQDYALFPDKTVFDNVAYGLRARKQDTARIRATVGEYLERVELSALADRLPAALSGGQRQRVALARALAIKPTVLLMDEPLSNLDAKLRLQVRDTISDLQKEIGITTVLVTHDQEEALAMSDRIGLIRDGSLEQVGTPQDLYLRPRTAYAADFVGAANTLSLTLALPAAAGALASVELAGKPLLAFAPATLMAGAATLVARGEALTLAPADGAVRGPNSANQIPCTVRRRQYLGARTVYSVALSTGATLSVEATLNQPDWAVGDAACLCFDPQKTLLLAA